MLALGSKALIRGHRLLTGLLESLYSDRILGPEQIFVHLGELQLLKKSAPAQGQTAFGELCLRLQERLAYASARHTSLSGDAKRELIEACDELRVRLLASALSVVACLGPSEFSTEDLLLDLQGGSTVDLLGTIIHGPAGLTHAAVGNARVVILPRFLSEHQKCKINEGLFGLFHAFEGVEHWVLDFSLIEKIPPLFFSNLYATVRTLRRSNSDVHLCWVQPHFFSEAQLPRAQEYFRLKKIGGYYFSTSNSRPSITD